MGMRYITTVSIKTTNKFTLRATAIIPPLQIIWTDGIHLHMGRAVAHD